MKITNVENLGALIKEARKKQGLTQTDVAIACNVGLRFIVDIEKGKETCQIGKVFQIVNMLGINIDAE